LALRTARVRKELKAEVLRHLRSHMQQRDGQKPSAALQQEKLPLDVGAAQSGQPMTELRTLLQLRNKIQVAHDVCFLGFVVDNRLLGCFRVSRSAEYMIVNLGVFTSALLAATILPMQ